MNVQDTHLSFSESLQVKLGNKHSLIHMSSILSFQQKALLGVLPCGCFYEPDCCITDGGLHGVSSSGKTFSIFYPSNYLSKKFK